jgi:hypothetical protein
LSSLAAKNSGTRTDLRYAKLAPVMEESLRTRILSFIANPTTSDPKSAETLHDLSRLQDILYDYRRANGDAPPKEIFGWQLQKTIRKEDKNFGGTDFLETHVYKKGDVVVPVVMGAKYTPGELFAEAKHIFTSKIPGMQTYVPPVWTAGIETLKELKKEYGDSLIALGHSRGAGIVQAFASQTGTPSVTFGTFPRPDDSILGRYRKDAPVANVYVGRPTSLASAGYNWALPDKVGKTVTIGREFTGNTTFMNSVAAHDMGTIYNATRVMTKARGNVPAEDLKPMNRVESPLPVKIVNAIPTLL